MPARDLSKQIEIKTPCTADWDSMIGNDRVRFCEHCNLSVNDLSQLTPKRVRRLITKSNGRLCVRYQRRPDGSPIIKALPQRLHTIGRRVSRIAAGAFTATLSLSSAVAQSAPSSPNIEQVLIVQIGSAPQPVHFGASISGRITDTKGAAIEGAGIILNAPDMSYLSGAITNSAGEYSIDGLLPGRYWLTVEAPGFVKEEMIQAYLTENETKRIDRSLEGESLSEGTENRFVLMGAVAVRIESPAEPLIAAAMEDDLQALEALLNSSNVNVRDKNRGTTALEHAVRNGNREMVQVLLSAGAEVNSRNKSKQTVLMMLGEESTADIVWDLINARAKVDLKDDEGDTALIEAAMEKNLPVLTALLHAGAKVDAKNDEGQTAIMLAASNEQVANIRALIRAGADMNARDRKGRTALDYAIEEDHEKVIKLLQSYGAITGEKPKAVEPEAN